MKVHLMYRDRDFDLGAKLPSNSEALKQDLELSTLLGAMAAGDRLLWEVSECALLTGLTDHGAIAYRQEVLHDCIAQDALVGQIFDLTAGALEETRRVWRGRFVDSIISGSVEMLRLLLPTLRQLRHIAEEHAALFRSEGFTGLFATLRSELDDDYFAELEGHIGRLRSRERILLSAQLERGNKAKAYVLRRPFERKGRWRRPFGDHARTSYSFEIHPRDDAGLQALGELRGRGLSLVANAVGQSADHVRSFLEVLHRELAFYRACVNLHGRLTAKGEPVCFPELAAKETPTLSALGLYDPCLTLTKGERVVGNDVDALGKVLVVITGANQGGKSTFLRSVGAAHLMMQCGMFVPAESLRADPRVGVFTHFKREEDAAMESGKLDEELARMSKIGDEVAPRSLVLFNESFASTNEREGSEIGREVVRAFVEAGIKVFYVTHLFDLAHSMVEWQRVSAMSLRAERTEDGQRTFRVMEGEPLPTSFGADVYRQVFGASST